MAQMNKSRDVENDRREAPLSPVCPRYDIGELVAAMANAEPPPLLIEDEARGSEVW